MSFIKPFFDSENIARRMKDIDDELKRNKENVSAAELYEPYARAYGRVCGLIESVLDEMRASEAEAKKKLQLRKR